LLPPWVTIDDRRVSWSLGRSCWCWLCAANKCLVVDLWFVWFVVFLVNTFEIVSQPGGHTACHTCTHVSETLEESGNFSIFGPGLAKLFSEYGPKIDNLLPGIYRDRHVRPGPPCPRSLTDEFERKGLTKKTTNQPRRICWKYTTNTSDQATNRLIARRL
jgi:hypothetical protein